MENLLGLEIKDNKKKPKTIANKSTQKPIKYHISVDHGAIASTILFIVVAVLFAVGISLVNEDKKKLLMNCNTGMVMLTRQ